MTMLDKRRTDQRDCILRYPFWLDSVMIEWTDDGYEIVLFSFPAAYGVQQWIIHEVCCEIITDFAGTTPLLDLGAGTIPLDTDGDGATVSAVDLDEYMKQGDITATTAGLYWAASSDWLTAAAANAGAARLITTADATVPVVYVTMGGTDLTAGQAVFHMQVSVVPFEIS